MPPLKLRISKF